MQTRAVARGTAGRAVFLGGALCSHTGPRLCAVPAVTVLTLLELLKKEFHVDTLQQDPKNVVAGPDSKNSRKESKEEGKTEAGESGLERNGIFKEEDNLAEREKWREGRRESESGRGNDCVVLN